MKRTTFILILLALLLGGFVYFYEIKWKTQQEQTNNKKQIFTFEADDVQSLTIETPGKTLKIERNNNSDSKWIIKSPEVAPASDASVFYLMDLLVSGQSDRTISADNTQLAEFGLIRPQAKIDITLKNQQTHQLILGKSDFQQSFLYAQIDPRTQPNGNVNVALVSPDFEKAVNRPLAEWKAVDNTKTITNPTSAPIIVNPTPPTPIPSVPKATPTPSVSNPPTPTPYIPKEGK